jgi:hypothetical protein
VTSLAASPDGHTLFYTASGTVWEVPSTGGAPIRLGPGDSVTVHPNGQKLLIKLNEAQPRLVWLDLARFNGGEPQPIPLHFPHGGQLSSHSLVPGSISPANAIFKEGRIVVEIVVPDSCFFQVAVIDPASGSAKAESNVEQVPVSFEGDVDYPAWTSDGKIVFLGRALGSGIWRFRPVK